MNGSTQTGRRAFVLAGVGAGAVALLAACGQAVSPAATAGPAKPVEAPKPPGAAESTKPAAAAPKPAEVTKPTEAAKPAAAAPPTGGQKVNLRFWTYYEPTSRAAEFPGLIKKYQDLNPGVTIELNAGFQNFNPTVQTAIVGGDPPEVLGCTQYLMRDLVKAGLIRDITDPLKESGLDKGLYLAALEGGSMNGKVWAVPDALRFGMWFYNAKVFQDLGLKEPATYADLATVSQAIRRAGKFPILHGLKDLGGGGTNSLQYLLPAIVGTTAIVKASEAKDYLSNPKFAETLGMYVKMLDDKIYDASDTGISGADQQAMLARGDAVMYPSASYAIGQIIGLKADIRAFKEPVKMVEKPLATYWGGVGQTYCIPKTNKFSDQSVKFLLWWFQPEQLKVQIDKSGLVSSVPEANKSITEPLSKFAVDNLPKVEPEGLFFNNYIPTAEGEAWGKAVQEVVSRQKTPQEAIKTIQAAVK
jgi:ABC-type glycerol-3-phosphate transport system substrate-binding protein